MSIASTESLVGQQVDLLSKLNDVLRQHPGGASFRLVFAPAEVAVAEDEVLVQRFNTGRGVVELHPRKLADLTPDDIVHATQQIDPTDTAVTAYATQPYASDCKAHLRADSTTHHLYPTRQGGSAEDAATDEAQPQAGHCTAIPRPDGTTGHTYSL